MSISNIICGTEPIDVEKAPRCPVCGTSGKGVKPETVKSIVKEEKKSEIMEGYALCLSPECDVVYFGQEIIRREDVRVKVWFKEKESPVPVCYCRNVTDEEIVNHIVSGCCKDINDIQRHTGANTGKECVTKNPAGT